MQINEKLVEEIVKAVIENVKASRNLDQGQKQESVENILSAGVAAKKGTNPKEVVIGVGPAFQSQIHKTINNIELEAVLENIRAGIEEEGLVSRVVKLFKTSDVAFIGLEAAKLSGSGIGIGLQSKGTVIIHQRDLYPLSNLELFPQAPLLTLETYRNIGKNAAKYAKGEKVSPIEGRNDPMVRASYQVKAALMHIKETEQVNKKQTAIEW